MKIIVRAAGERTESECIALAQLQGEVIVVRKRPFGEAVRETYRIGSKMTQKWIPVIDADVLLHPGILREALKWLGEHKGKIFCLDGRTEDKITCRTRRAGIHIYNRKHLLKAVKYVDDKHIKPESHARKQMAKLGFKTVAPRIIFGLHDYEQFYCDLWRKAVTQTRKLAKMIKKKNLVSKWKRKLKKDDDYRVILEAHRHGIKYTGQIIIDKAVDYNAVSAIKLLGYREKKPL